MSETRRSPRPGGGSSLRARLRQLRYPPAFRIAPPTWPPDLYEALERIDALLDRERRAPSPAGTAGVTTETSPIPVADEGNVDDAALIEAAMGLWRTSRRLDGAADGEAQQLARQLRRPMARAWDGLKQLGLEVRDHEGEHFDSGISLEVLTMQPEPGLSRETIIDTVRPTIIRSGRRIQQGQVVVGQPEEA